jgi:hypothetical protein
MTSYMFARTVISTIEIEATGAPSTSTKPSLQVGKLCYSHRLLLQQVPFPMSGVMPEALQQLLGPAAAG